VAGAPTIGDNRALGFVKKASTDSTTTIPTIANDSDFHELPRSLIRKLFPKSL
jgi:hypothetical protein